MANQRTLAKNTMYLTFASIAQKAIAFVYFALIARAFGTADTGSYFVALALVTVIAVFDDLGMTPVLIREIAKAPERALHWVRTMMGIKVITMPLTMIIAWFLPHLMGYEIELIWLVRLAIVIMLADTLSLSFYGVLRGLHNLKYESIGIFFGQIITAGIGVTLIFTGQATLLWLVLALAFGSTWNLVFSGVQVVRRLGPKALVPTYADGWKPLKLAFAFFLAAAFVKIYSFTDSILLERLIGAEEAGIYAVAYKMTYAFQFLPLAFIGALYPMLSAQANDAVKLKQTLMHAFWYLSLLVVPIVFGIWSLAEEIIVAFYGVDFTLSAISLQILIFVLVFIFLDFPIGSLLNATNRQATKTAIMGVTMVINVVANILLIPTYGAVGASIAGLISFIFLFFAGWFFARRVIPLRFIDLASNVWGIWLSGIVMTLVVLFAKQYVHFSFAIVIGALVYMVGLFLTRAVTIEQVKSIKRLLV
jgi:O-antigen/teichoic acid export membrane protein